MHQSFKSFVLNFFMNFNLINFQVYDGAATEERHIFFIWLMGSFTALPEVKY